MDLVKKACDQVRRNRDGDLAAERVHQLAGKQAKTDALINQLEVVLNGVEWFGCDEMVARRCPFCLEDEEDGHNADCPRLSALAAVKEWREGK